ncbi:hypothetical protein CLV35_3196 [Motilibacter peucedani]|uniref:DUF5317 domain-containing protein n=1 Tax=Motilibacter peucedani TaxID=598650 RepID=A0A420XM64_9ACTN|nr:DUF5317 family protein [Motilibacter peucedani]RKS71398.1 hypothetical protein CLV35_3196 [Motilibacter peucedani]
MGLVLLAAVGAVLVGLATGGSLRALASVRVLGLPVLALGVAAQAGALLAPAGDGVRAALVALSVLAALVVVVVNRGLAGVWLIGAGLLLNAAVVAANGAMPVSLDAAHRAGISERALGLGADPGREEAGSGTRLRVLSDTLPLAFPPRREVVSAGDVLVAAGAAAFLLSALRSGGALRRRS